MGGFDINKYSSLISEDEVASVDNDMARSMASEKVGYGTTSLLEQWKDSYDNGDYDDDPHDDDMYEGQKIIDKLQAICDNLDIKVRREDVGFTLIHINKPQRGVGASTWPPTPSSISHPRYRNAGHGVNAGPHGVTVPNALRVV
ncbi:hypothetical protein Tco_0699924 [Tanacetum coccineum]